MGNRAIFLDRDGTLMEEDVGLLHRIEDVHVFPCAFVAVRRINESGALAVVATNQSPIARGLLTEEELHCLHDYVRNLFLKNEARINAFYYCPHHPEIGNGSYTRACSCRKPEPGLLFRAAEEMHIDLAKSYLIGDRRKDVEAAARAGCGSVLVKTGGGLNDLALAAGSVHPNCIAEDVLEAVEWIFRQTCETKGELF